MLPKHFPLKASLHTPLYDHFGAVDQATHPENLVHILSAERDIPYVQATKKLSHTLMEASVGKHLLDVGCGIGDDVRALAQLVGSQGRAVGVDSSQIMLDTARSYSATTDLPGEFYLQDIDHLQFEDATFDACRAERVLQHCCDSAQALTEMIRVVRPGGKIIIVETEFDSMIHYLSNPELSRKLTRFHGEGSRNRYIVRQLPGLLRQHSLSKMQLLPRISVMTECDASIIDEWRLKEDFFSSEEIMEIKRDAKQIIQNGQFFSMMVCFIFVCTKR